MKSSILYILLSLLLLACRHDPIEIPIRCEGDIYASGDTCIVIPPSSSVFGYDAEVTAFDQRRPVFNPTNPNEILYLHINTDPFTRFYTELRIFNLCTGEDRLITDKAEYNPDWSVKDWIIFEDPGFQLWKIKSNGDSLTQLTFQHQHNCPKWSPDGKFFLHYLVDGPSLGKTVLMNEDGELIKQYKPDLGSSLNYSWSPDGNRFLLSFYSDIRIGNIEGELVDSFPDISPALSSLAWHPVGKDIYWSDRSGIYKTNLETRKTHPLLKRCESNKSYVVFSISPNMDQMIFEQRYLTKTGNNLLLHDWFLVSLDMDGSNERKIMIEK